jgi:hypothetical protein
MAVIDVCAAGTSSAVTTDLVVMGTETKGSGSFVAAALRRVRFHSKLFGASSASPDFERAVINKSLFAGRTIRMLVERRGEHTVGGHDQAACLLSDRVRTISYDRWAECSGALGTWATLANRDRRFYEEHEPTSQNQLLMNPFVERVESDFDQDLLFDLAQLPATTPGMRRNSRPRVGSRFRSAYGVAGREGILSTHLRSHADSRLASLASADGSRACSATLPGRSWPNHARHN